MGPLPKGYDFSEYGFVVVRLKTAYGFFRAVVSRDSLVPAATIKDPVRLTNEELAKKLNAWRIGSGQNNCRLLK